METIETLIPDNEGNHLVVVLYFYDDEDKEASFHIPSDFTNIEIVDINIRKLDLEHPLGLKAFFNMCHWLCNQFMMFPNTVFSFICSTDPIDSRHTDVIPELYRWSLFDNLYKRYSRHLENLGIRHNDIIVGPIGYQTFARVFYRDQHASIIHFVTSHLNEKYND